MKKINNDLIEKYINGDDIEDYSIEDLENDREFMIKVIDYTNDLNIYNLCSDNLKIDYEFIKYVIFKFKDNTEFIDKVYKYFSDNSDNEEKIIELGIIMEGLVSKELLQKYQIINQINYSTNRFSIEIEIYNDSSLKGQIGKGFIVFFDKYSGNDVIINYYAKCMIDEILKENDIEKLLHSQFTSPDKISKMGINNYIINYLSCYDSFLGSYVSTHLDLIKDLLVKVKDIELNWDKYIKEDEAKRYRKMIDMVYEYMSMNDGTVDGYDMLHYVSKELGIIDKVIEYHNPNGIDEETKDAILDEDINEAIKMDIEYDIHNKSNYLNVKKIIMNQLFSDKPRELHEFLKPIKNTEEDEFKMYKYAPNEEE